IDLSCTPYAVVDIRGQRLDCSSLHHASFSVPAATLGPGTHRIELAATHAGKRTQHEVTVDVRADQIQPTLAVAAGSDFANVPAVTLGRAGAPLWCGVHDGRVPIRVATAPGARVHFDGKSFTAPATGELEVSFDPGAHLVNIAIDDLDELDKHPVQAPW